MTIAASSVTTARPARRRDAALLWHQVRYEQLSFWRNPQSAFFTFLLPVVIIVIFGALFGGVQKDSYFYGLSALQYYVPTIAALSVLGSCYGQLAMALATRRQLGVLKRVHATPLPTWTYFAGLLVHCIVWVAIGATLVLGAASFCALGVAVASVISNAEAAPAVVQLVMFPLLFISGTYVPIHSATLNRISGALPVRPLNEALIAAFSQHSGPAWGKLGILLAWGAAGTVVAIWRFRWTPRSG